MKPILAQIWTAKGTWVRNLSLLQNMKPVALNKYSGLLTASVSQAALSIKGW